MNEIATGFLFVFGGVIALALGGIGLLLTLFVMAKAVGKNDDTNL